MSDCVAERSQFELSGDFVSALQVIKFRRSDAILESISQRASGKAESSQGCLRGTNQGGNLFRRKETSWRVAKPVCMRPSKKMLVAIQKFDQRPLNVIIPLVPRFEREVLEAPDRFLLRHLSNDHRAGNIECEVLRVLFRRKSHRSVDKRSARSSGEPPRESRR